MTYPEYANIRGTRYKIDTDYRTALRCFEVINDDAISDEERALAVVFILFGLIPENGLLGEFLQKAKLFLQCGAENPETDIKPTMDVLYDQKYINVSFISDYHIDITKEKMHWWQYCDMITGFSENAVMSRIRDIREYDLSEVKDSKTRGKIAAAQQFFALPTRYTKEEREAIDAFEKLFEGGADIG